MLNLLIAMMGKTFQDSHEDTHCTWIFPFAKQVGRSAFCRASKRALRGHGAGWGGGQMAYGHTEANPAAGLLAPVSVPTL